MKTLRARWVFPVAAAPINQGTVTIDGGRIVAVGRECCGDVVDCGNAAILPGLVNAHTHLDFSSLAAPLGTPGMEFADWLELVMADRAQAEQDTERALQLGLDESLRCGTTTLADTAQPGWPAALVAASPLDVTVFQEIIGPTPERIASALELAGKHCDMARRSDACRLGLSPHAPYSVHPDLLAALVQISAAQRLPLAMHLAESAAELQLLHECAGPLRDFLVRRGIGASPLLRPGRRPLDYLRVLAKASRVLVVHGGYLDETEIAFLAARAERMAVVYCARTHQWFARSHYPLEKMAAAGVTIALGTDGRGSTPDLNMLAEMRCAAAQHPALALSRILQMATLGGAKALGREAEIGSLAPGKRADVTVAPLPDRDAADPHDLLFAAAAPAVACYCGGQKINSPTSAPA